MIKLIGLILLIAMTLLPGKSFAAQTHRETAQAESVSDLPQLPLRVTARQHRYATTGYALYFAGTAYGWLALWGVLASGLSAKLRTWAEGRARYRLAQIALYYAGLSLLLGAIEFPIDWYGGYWREHSYGLSGQSFLAWEGDQLKSGLVNIAVGVPLLGLLFWLIGKTKRWSVWLWAALVPIIAFGIFAAPVVIDPIFNHFTPLPAGALRTRIAALAQKAGIPDAPISVADQSQRTSTANAYVTGLGPSARIVIWDTTSKQLPEDEVVGIVAHEMGHFVLHHVQRGFWETVAGLLFALPLLQWIVSRLVAMYGARWKLRGMTDMAVLPAILLTLSVMGFLGAPITNGLSRQIEHAADAYGLQASHDGPAMARAFAYFSAHDLSDPYPPKFIKFWLFSHPPIGERINFVLGRK